MSDAVQELHQRDALRARLKPEPMKGIRITREDVGKVFVLREGKEVGELVTRETFATIPVAQIHMWDTVTEFDVPV